MTRQRVENLEPTAGLEPATYGLRMRGVLSERILDSERKRVTEGVSACQ